MKMFQCFRWLICLLVMLSALVLHNQLSADIIAYYKFDDGHSVNDEVGENHGTLIHNAGFSTDTPDGSAFSLDLTAEGTGPGQDYVRIGPSVSGGGAPEGRDLGIADTNSFSITAWINYTQSQRGVVTIKQDLTSGGGDRSGITFGIDPTEKLFVGIIASTGDENGDRANTGGTFRDILTADNVPTGEWAHIAATYDFESDILVGYINGVASESYTVNPAGSINEDGTNITGGTGIDFFDNDGAFTGLGSSGNGPVHGDSAGDFTRLFYDGLLDEVSIWDEALAEEQIRSIMANGVTPFDITFAINGSGETYFEDFDGMGTGRLMPRGWRGEDTDGSSRSTDSFGLVDGPLAGVEFSAEGIVNVGGNTDRFSSPADGRLGTWKDDLDGSGLFDRGDVITDAASDRALGNARVEPTDPGSLTFEIEITERPLRAFTAEWDLEVWGGDPEGAFRGSEGAGYATELKIGENSYHTQTATLNPGELFDSEFDISPGATHDPTLINGNEHSVRSNTSDIIEVSVADGAVGNSVQWTFDANHGDDDGGWIPAIDNVQFRALAAGDAQGDGDVDPSDLIQLLAGGAFGQGNIDASWGQGDFDNDGDFDGFDVLAIVQGLAGEFPKTYAHDPSNGVPDVLINPATGNITLDTNGTTIGSIVMDSAAGIFNGPNSPSWDAPGDFAADIDTQISMPISFTNPAYTGVDDLGDGIIGDLAPGFDILADLTIKYLDPNGDLLDAEAHVVPEPSSIVLATFGILGMLGYLRRRRLG